jgi:hypothetical protein
MRREASMKISQEERSNYYRGLLIVMRRDRLIDTREREFMLKIGEMFDFDKKFCEAAMDDLLNNSHIERKPIAFRDALIAQSFLTDAIRLAFVDRELHPKEIAWLRLVAQANGIPNEWLEDIVQRFLEGMEEPDQSLMAIQRHM